MMQSITFECEVITPMFLAGADGVTPELRPPSIKGALRFWWRALNGHLPLGKLKEREGKIFGSTDFGRSKVLIRVQEDMEWDKRSSAAPTPHKPKYFKNAFRPGQTFSIALTLTQKVALGGNEYFTSEDLEKLFLLTATLGGIGGRVRRGFGAFSILNVKNSVLNIKQPKVIQEIEKLLANEHFRKVDKKIVSLGQRMNKYPYIKEIEIGSPNADILKKIGFTTHEVKGINSYNYETALGHASRGRFASPIYVSILKTAMGLRPIIVTLNTAPDNSKRVDYRLQNTFKDKIL
jgi:CRISPR-associated protein Cmr1